MYYRAYLKGGLEIFYRSFIKEKYLEAFDNILTAVKLPSMYYVAHMYNQGWLKDDWLEKFNEISPFIVRSNEDLSHINMADLPDKSIWLEGSVSILLLHLTGEYSEMCTQRDIEKLKMTFSADKVLGILPNQLSNYKKQSRFIIDKIFIDAQLSKSTDVHIEPIPNIDGTSKYSVRFRMGINMQSISSEINLTDGEVHEIIYDCINNRSNSSSKASDALTVTPVIFRLVDAMYPSRCQTMPTEFGPMLVIRFFNFKDQIHIDQLGFDDESVSQLKYTARLTNGLTLISGGKGSGKGTTVNAMALQISGAKKMSMISLDSPIEYIGDYPCVEYNSTEQLQLYANVLKKLDRNIVFLNEIATQGTAREVLNLVVSGVHVLTTLHSQRVYNIFYKLNEQLGNMYTTVIPYLNYVSFQDKYSITCKSCQQVIYKGQYDDKKEHKMLLDFFSISSLKQPKGCSKCDLGIVKVGIQVVSEGVLFNDRLKQELIREDIHTQASIMKRESISQSNHLENIIKVKLISGEILISEVLQKLDTWR